MPGTTATMFLCVTGEMAQNFTSQAVLQTEPLQENPLYFVETTPCYYSKTARFAAGMAVWGSCKWKRK